MFMADGEEGRPVGVKIADNMLIHLDLSRELAKFAS